VALSAIAVISAVPLSRPARFSQMDRDADDKKFVGANSAFATSASRSLAARA
jgi:hypothetical protein